MNRDTVSLLSLQERVRLKLYLARQQFLRQARSFYRDLLVVTGLRLGRMLDVSQKDLDVPSIERKVLKRGYAVQVNDNHLKRFLQMQTTVPAREGRVERGDISVCFVRNARLDVATGVVCTESNKMLLEAPWEKPRLKSSSTYGSKAPVDLLRRPGTCSTVWGIWPDNYYHWLVEFLPRLYSLKLATDRPVSLLMPDCMTDFQRQALNFVLPDNVTVEYIHGGKWVQAEEFIFLPSVLAGLDYPLIPRDYFDYLRQGIFEKFRLSSDPQPEAKIYISRQNAKKRRVLNETEVVECLSAYGFQSYCLEALSFEDQVRLFHRAKVVVAPHGAGLTNLIFAGDIKVLELVGMQPIPVFLFLALSLGQQYAYLLCEEAKRILQFATPAQYGQYRAAIDRDFTVDVAELDRTVGQMVSSLAQHETSQV